MKIELVNLPEEGQAATGEIPAEVFELTKGYTKAASPLRYDLMVQRFDSELLLTGALSATFELTCMRSLHPFLQTIELPSVAVSIEITDSGVVDASEALREEVLIELPDNPRCENGDNPATCEIDPRYLAVDNVPKAELDNASAQDEPNPWDALDALKDND